MKEIKKPNKRRTQWEQTHTTYTGQKTLMDGSAPSIPFFSLPPSFPFLFPFPFSFLSLSLSGPFPLPFSAFRLLSLPLFLTCPHRTHSRTAILGACSMVSQNLCSQETEALDVHSRSGAFWREVGTIEHWQACWTLHFLTRTLPD